MSIVLYTPATGFPDLEVKIAYGLARVGIEAFGVEKVAIENKDGFYTINIEANENEFFKLNRTFNLLCKRLLASEHIPLLTPGIKKSGTSGGFVGNIITKENENFSLEVYQQTRKFYRNHTKDELICDHTDTKVVGTVLGLAAESSYHRTRNILDIGPSQKDTIRRPTEPKKICKTCALLALLGIWYASFIFQVAEKEVIAIPMLKGKISGLTLQEIFSIQHEIRKNWFNQEIPQTAIPLVLLSKIPSSADILQDFDLFIAVLSRQQGYHVDGLYLIPIENYLDFIRQTSYNVATIENILRNKTCESLQELNNIIYNRNKVSLPKFARLYVAETSTNKFTNLLYPETTKYFLKEVAMISQEIIENPALKSFARTLQYFIKEKKYSYADNIRNAKKEAKDFEETIAKMLREGRLRLEQSEMIHIPSEEEIKEVFRLANQDFEATKIALTILAFSFLSKAEVNEATEIEETINITEEVEND